MKKLIMTCLLLLSTTTFIFASETEKYARKKGDITLAIDATPFLQYTADLLNFSGGSSATAPTFNSFQSDFLGKYFLKENAAVRVRIGITSDNIQSRYYVRDDKAISLDPLSIDKLIDEKRSKNFNMEIGVGYEHRLGLSKRVQGYAGGEVFMGSGKTAENYTYGNQFSTVNQNPTTSDFAGSTINPTQRTLSQKTTGNFTYGAAGIIGVEVYLTPQISIGGEIRLEFRGTRHSQAWMEQERWDANANTLVKETIPTKPKSHSFGLNGQNSNIVPTAGLNIGFHF